MEMREWNPFPCHALSHAGTLSHHECTLYLGNNALVLQEHMQSYSFEAGNHFDKLCFHQASCIIRYL